MTFKKIGLNLYFVLLHPKALLNKLIMKKKIDVVEYAPQILKALAKGGILLNTEAEGRWNTMTIGWATIGREWEKPMFTVYVRTSRFTHAQLEKNPSFTVSIPVGEIDRKILGQVGTKSGWKIDKSKDYGLTLVPAEVNGVSGIKEFPLTIECKVVYRQVQERGDIHTDNVEHLYPTDVEDDLLPRNSRPHEVYYGEM